MARELGVGTCQISTVPGDFEANLKALERSIEVIRYNSPWVKLICAHELCIQGVLSLEDVAQEIPGPLTDELGAMAKRHGIYLVPGSLYERRNDVIHNTAPVFDPRGQLMALYRKLYPWKPGEKTEPGRDTLVFDIPGAGRVGVCICYDLWFPEVIRDLAWKGAEVILIPTSTSTPDRRQELVLAQAAAIANQCFIVSVNGTGKGGIGQSIMADPEGTVMQLTGQVPENMAALLDLERVASVRRNGTCGISRPLASFFQEGHSFAYQRQPYSDSPLYEELQKL
jgi:formamidase